MGFMERLGYVKKGRYEEVVRERDNLRRSIAELEDKIKVLEADSNSLKKRVEFLKMAVPAITKIKNVGPRTAQRLKERGIKNIIDLIESTPQKIAEATALTKERAQKMIDKAMNLIKKQAS